jgi:hypothetical protein
MLQGEGQPGEDLAPAGRDGQREQARRQGRRVQAGPQDLVPDVAHPGVTRLRAVGDESEDAREQACRVARWRLRIREQSLHPPRVLRRVGPVGIDQATEKDTGKQVGMPRVTEAGLRESQAAQRRAILWGNPPDLFEGGSVGGVPDLAGELRFVWEPAVVAGNGEGHGELPGECGLHRVVREKAASIAATQVPV